MRAGKAAADAPADDTHTNCETGRGVSNFYRDAGQLAVGDEGAFALLLVAGLHRPEKRRWLRKAEAHGSHQ